MKEEENEFMRHELRLPELTARGMLLGAILTVIFTASNVYLGLKVGLTFSSAIPAAVRCCTHGIFRCGCLRLHGRSRRHVVKPDFGHRYPRYHRCIARHVCALLILRYLCSARRRKVRDSDGNFHDIYHPRDCLHLKR